MVAEAVKPKAQHKVAKGDTIEKIARKYGFKNIDDIWKYPKNAALVKLRKDPKAIEPGDVVVIPAYNDEERADIRDRQKKYLYAANAEKYAASCFADRAAANRAAADHLTAIMRDHAVAGAEYIKQFEATVSTADRWSQGVDAASAVIGLVRALKSIAAKGIETTAKAAEQGMKAFEEGNKELLKMAAEFTSAPLTSEATKQTGKALVNQDSGQKHPLFLFAGVAIESYGKWTSPSFYGQAIGILAEGKGFNKAVTFDLKQDCKDTVAKMKAEQAALQKAAAQKIADLKKGAAELDKAAKAAQAKWKEFAAEAKARP